MGKKEIKKADVKKSHGTLPDDVDELLEMLDKEETASTPKARSIRIKLRKKFGYYVSGEDGKRPSAKNDKRVKSKKDEKIAKKAKKVSKKVAEEDEADE